MSDGDLGADFDCDPSCGYWYGRFSWPRLLLKLVIAYAMLTFFCWQEVRYRFHAIEVTADVEVVGRHPKGGTLVRYSFHDPQTGQRKQNTVTVAERPTAATASVQYIPGDLSSSRLASQARPAAVTIFVTINTLLLLAAAGTIGYWAWEANHKPLTRQQRAVAAYRRRQQLSRG